jgi:uncharacterized RDD family membrane protein YckC
LRLVCSRSRKFGDVGLRQLRAGLSEARPGATIVPRLFFVRRRNPMDSNASPSSQRYAPPSAEVADVSARGESVLAGRGIRLVAAIIDTLILMALFWVISLVTPLNIFSPAMASAGFFTKLAIQAGSMALFAAVHGYLLATRGQTIGKMLFGIRIVRPDGSPASLGRVLGLRYGVGYVIAATHISVLMVYSLVDCLLIFRANRRCLHDLIADTIVVKI